MYRIGIASFTERGAELADRLEAEFGRECQFLRCSGQLKQWCRDCFAAADGIIFIGACGIAVRTVAPFLKSKTTDPAVLVIDEAGRFVISLLSGHIGGANEFAAAVADRIGAVPVITTASDVNGKLAVDVFAKKNHLAIGSMQEAKRIAAALVRGEKVLLCCSGQIEGIVPPELCLLKSSADERETECRTGESEKGKGSRENGSENVLRDAVCCDSGKNLIWISEFAPSEMRIRRIFGESGSSQEASAGIILHLIPRSVVLGIGCRRGRPREGLRRITDRVLKEEEIPAEALCQAASIDLKKNEPGILGLCEDYGIELVTYSAQELMHAEGDFETSEFVRKMTGADNVCERAAVLAAGTGGRLIRKKYAEDGVTVALAVREWRVHFEK